MIGRTARRIREVLVAAVYSGVGRSCVMRRTQLALSEMGRENTLRRPMTAKLIMRMVLRRKS